MSGHNLSIRVFSSLRHARLALVIFLLGVPLIILLLWGMPFEDLAFSPYQTARVLATQGTAVFDLDTLSQAPLFIFILAANSANALKTGLLSVPMFS